jgi:hypothetical protein
MTGDYLRTQARTCLAWARDCFDLTTATRLRLMAEEFAAKADEIEAADEASFESYGIPARSRTFEARSDDS